MTLPPMDNPPQPSVGYVSGGGGITGQIMTNPQPLSLYAETVRDLYSALESTEQEVNALIGAIDDVLTPESALLSIVGIGDPTATPVSAVVDELQNITARLQRLNEAAAGARGRLEL